MPTIQLPVRHVLDESLDDQLSAVWHVLNQPDFQPPRPNAVRVVRRSGAAEKKERAAVLTDVIRAPEKTYVKPLLIGLPNRHDVLFDLETARLAAWRLGDVAHQHTEGKTWFWELAGINLLQSENRSPDISLVREGGELEATVEGQFAAQFGGWTHGSIGGVMFVYFLRFADNSEPLMVMDTVTPLRKRSGFESGFRRIVRLIGYDEGMTVKLRVVDADAARQSALSASKRTLTLNDGNLQIKTIFSKSTFERDGFVLARPGSIDVVRVFELHYKTKFPIKPPIIKKVEFPAPEVMDLDVVPGYTATRLPLDSSIMPTGLAWRPDGTLIIASLKGRVWLAHDTNNDGLEDDARPFSDELAAPYGVQAAGDDIDVVNKYALLRLSDRDSDGRADGAGVLASGWGHTTDYHDWVVGLPRDQEGNYYIAIPCQQDKRSLAAAVHHGQVLKLVPRKSEKNDKGDRRRRFEIETISSGHRFPMGIARNRFGELFVTDNQGNYNPFNELNHVQPGKHFGFINSLERTEDFKPELTPPAIDIPHPWTRSVNGICFLETPESVKKELGRDLFGPFEGHLIGCEYDTRRLIRMSLQKVGDTYQGAAYPFSYDQPPTGPPLLGPLVAAIAPDGDLYIGNIRDSGWGGSNNIGSVVRMRPKEDRLAPGIAEVRAISSGFRIQFTQPMDPRQAGEIENYSVSSYTRVSTPQYGGKDQDRRIEKIARVEPASDGRSVSLTLDELRPGFVYEIRTTGLGESKFFPAEAYYTLRTFPK